jgi:hypothetical protein
MKFKTACFLMLATLGFLAATANADPSKSYRITISDAVKVGTAELKPGDYTLVFDAPKVRLTERASGAAVELEAKVESGDQKFDSTEIHTQEVDGVRKISEIRLGGSKTRIDFR